jgi:hypothetical protein
MQAMRQLKLSHPMEVPMARSLVLLSLVLSLTGCGVAETGAAAAAAGVSKAEEARQGLKTEARVREQLDAAAKQAAEQRNAAEAAAQ